MKLSVMLNGVEDSIEILSPAPACRFRTGGGDERQAHVEVPEPGVYSIDGYRFEIDVHDPRRWTRKSSGRGDAGIQRIIAPMPGKVVRVLISPGDPVEAGQGLVVVEAMKMQNELKATRPGKVITVPAKEGATVAAGEILATIE